MMPIHDLITLPSEIVRCRLALNSSIEMSISNFCIGRKTWGVIQGTFFFCSKGHITSSSSSLLLLLLLLLQWHCNLACKRRGIPVVISFGPGGEKRSINLLKKFLKNLMTNFVLIAVSVKVALEITKRAQHWVYPDSYLFLCFEIARSAASRVYRGHLENEWVIKTFRKHPKCSKFVCMKSSLQCMHNLYPFYRNSKISRTSS